MFSYNRFAFGINQSVGETIIAGALTGARWSVLGWDWYIDTFFSPAASRRYEWAGQMIACLGMLTYLYGKRLWYTVKGYQQLEEHQEIENEQSITTMPSVTSQDIPSEPVSPVTTDESDDIDRLKIQAKGLGIKGWNLYKSAEKLEEKIRQQI